MHKRSQLCPRPQCRDVALAQPRPGTKSLATTVSARPRYLELLARKTTQLHDSTTFPSAECSGSHELLALKIASTLS
eukprot:15460697-Alexandrium_andersonii.AAC.1